MNRKLAKIISSQTTKVFLVAACLQALVIFVLMGYLSYNAALSRSKFLIQSSKQSLGLTMSIGDVFQMQNLINSFKNDQTPIAWMLDAHGENFLDLVGSSKPLSIPVGDHVLVYDSSILVVTKEPISYNDKQVGYIILANKIKFNEWLLVSGSILIFAFVASFFQVKYLERKSLELAESVTEIGTLFDHSGSRDDLDSAFHNRRQTKIDEVEMLAKQTFDSIHKIIANANVEKEAAIGRITANISHDLRGPLGAIERLIAITGEQYLGAKANARESLNRLYAMIESLRHTEVEDVIQRTSAKLDLSFSVESLRTKAENKGIRLVVSNVVDSILFMDSTKLERAWTNLISNGIEFAQSTVAIEVHLQQSTLIIRVIDDGPGVPEDFLPQLFQRGATHGKHDGTGLGLAYVRQIMRGHGGDVAYRRENNMTVFECYLPNAVVEPVSDEAQKIQESREVANPPEPQKAVVKQVSICFASPELSQRVFDRLSGISQESYNFVLGASQESAIVLTDSEEIADQLHERKVRPILINSLSDDEIVRRAPIRLGIKG